MAGIKNFEKAEVVTLKEQIDYQKGQVVSKTMAQNEHLSVTLFAFDKDEEISTHESGGDAFVPAWTEWERLRLMEKNIFFMKENRL